MGDTTGRLYKPRRCQIGQGHHGPRREVHEVRAAVGFECNHTLDQKASLAQMQRVADRKPKRLQQGWVNPDCASFRDGVSGHIWSIERGAGSQSTSQGIAWADRLHRTQHRGRCCLARAGIGQCHAGKTHRLRAAQSTGLRLLEHGLGQGSI